mmetsp:Transcript_23062/g.75185  ORF Transcript_23062/g.75185 Transcript_23062/m.75185 type:complete len:130 (-) Transcript_23062:725-1114(-)
MSLAIIPHPLFVHALPKAPERVEWADRLPEAALTAVVDHLSSSPRDLCTFSSVSKLARAVADEDGRWRELCCRDFGAPRRAKPPPGGFKKLYRYLAEEVWAHLRDPSLQAKLEQVYPRLPTGPILLPRA